ncbi:aldo/keto reductase [Methanomassiliicoccus luminyensis]|jgi:diketogulonate reductase-like aldo/keto reductase|uniref:aldo/keto reductase n=1 Tax=Methanomassiliicoccus luminyensis TaxID=1080712 RepID=UPI000378D9A5|nr:aldo/keto reductase [Methanomassiliicoccus luminyensis]
MIVTDSLRMGSRVRLGGGSEMPVLGFGTWKLAGGTCARAVREAVEAGYRLIDTASMYNNEEDVGEGIRQSGIDPEELFVTTKLWSNEHGYENAMRACHRSLGKLGLDRVDLYLIHWPGGRNLDTWKAMIRLMEDEAVGAIGVSNFSLEQVDELTAGTGVTPEVDQVEFNPENSDDALLAGCRSRGIVLEAYSPLRGTDLRDAAISEIARRHSRTAAQTVLRWVLQKGAVPIVKTSHRDRMLENAELFDFSLTPEEMGAIDKVGRF